MRFDRRGCLLALGAGLVVAGAGLVPAVLFTWAFTFALRDILPLEPLVALLVPLTFLFWGLFSFAAVVALFAILGRREAVRRRRFEDRAALADEQFAGLVPEAPAAVITAVRAELERFIGRAEVARRLLPADPVRATSRLVGFDPDDLDWAEFVLGLEARFGSQFPAEAGQEATVAQLLAWCAEANPAAR